MWSSVKTEAMVLTAEPWKEADKRYRALSPTLGKIEFIGRGARKGKAKLSAHLEPFAVVQLELIRGKRNTTVIGVERLEAFSALATNIDTRLAALSAVGFLDLALRLEAEDRALYEELMNLLRFLNETPAFSPTRANLVVGGFLLRVLGHLGYEVELSSCLTCKEAIRPLSFRWHDAKGGLVCTDCTLKHAEEWFSAKIMEEETVTMLRFAREAEYGDLLRPALKAEQVSAFAGCVNDLLRHHVPGFDRVTASWLAS